MTLKICIFNKFARLAVNKIIGKFVHIFIK